MTNPDVPAVAPSPAPAGPPPVQAAWGRKGWVAIGAIAALTIASFASLDLKWAAFLEPQGIAAMRRFAGEFFPPDLSPTFWPRVVRAAWETLAMSAVGTALAALMGLLLALPAARLHGRDPARWRWAARTVLNALRSIPELVWAALLLIGAGLGPLAGTLALALHTSGVLGRLFAESLENAPPGPAAALRTQGVPEGRVLMHATLPLVLPQLVSYTLYRWENNIRAAAILGVVGAGGLGQMLTFHLGLFQMGRTATVLMAMLVLVAVVDALSFAVRRRLTR